MTKKVTLTLPDDLYEEAQKLKGKKKGKLNFSGIFQKALAKAIKNEEDFERRLKEDQTMEQIVERLRKEKIALEGDYYDKGQRRPVIRPSRLLSTGRLMRACQEMKI